MYYAQRKEDEKLVALLSKNGVLRRDGFYCDVGAWHPTTDSVTKYFYDLGWSGINLEPVPMYHEMLKAERPRDINLRMAASDHHGLADFTYIEGTGLSTFVPEYVQKFASYSQTTLRVQLIPLKLVFFIYAPYKKIDFLKIDVEGHEGAVLRGNDWNEYRPTILCIEATEPGTEGASAIPAWDDWDGYVLAQGYEFIEFDGLNRWYRNAR